MELWTISFFIFLLLTATAKPEISSKGKHTRVLDTQQQSSSNEDGDMPRFAEPIANVTVSIGRDALLACVVENLKGYKVAWVRVDTQTILSIHHNLISQNNRISLTYNDHRSWYLHIKEVEESDRGWYMCQINTDPMRSRKGYLQVVVPPMIVEGMTSNDLVVREGLNVTLVCKARGYPEPYVMWRREDGEEMLIGGEHVNVVDGELLHITKVSRLHMAAYLCVASNGVPPSISKRVHLRVQFPPMLSIPNQLEGAYLGQDVVLECQTEAYPASINYWTTERGDMIISDTSRAGDKYETTSTVSGYTKFMKLKIRSVGPNDFGTYRCVAKNSLGETDGNIKLDEMPTPTTAIISEKALWNRSMDGKRRYRNKFDSNALPDYGVEEWRDGAGNGGLNGGNHIHGGDGSGDNNQTPELRNPPGAFHNSAGGGLAQHNLLGRIIHGIKLQSFGILKHLSRYFVAKRMKEVEMEMDFEVEGNVNSETTTTAKGEKNHKKDVVEAAQKTHNKQETNQMLKLVNVQKKYKKWNKNFGIKYADDVFLNHQRQQHQQQQHVNENELKLRILQISNNAYNNMRRFLTNLLRWPKSSTTRFALVKETANILKARSIRTAVVAVIFNVTTVICIQIFSILVMLMLLHLIIDSDGNGNGKGNDSNRNDTRSVTNENSLKIRVTKCKNENQTTHKTLKTEVEAATAKSSSAFSATSSLYSISQNRHLPLPSQLPLALVPPTQSQSSITSLSLTKQEEVEDEEESNFQISLYYQQQQQHSQSSFTKRNQKKQQITKFYKMKTTTATTPTRIINKAFRKSIPKYPLRLAIFSISILPFVLLLLLIFVAHFIRLKFAFASR